MKETAAKTETAWQGSGEKVGLEIWRIVKFQVVPWPKAQYGMWDMEELNLGNGLAILFIRIFLGSARNNGV